MSRTPAPKRATAHVDWIAGLRWESLSEPVRRQARRCLKDIVATAAGSLALPAAPGIERLVAAQFGAGPAPMLFRGPRTTLAGAAFGNALRIDGLDCHDGFRPNKGHAGATVVPVLLAALVAGYEVALRAGANLLAVPADEIDAVLGAAEYHGPMAPILRCTVHPSIVKDGAGAGALAAALALAMHAQGLRGLPSLFTYEPKGREQAATFGTNWLIVSQYFKLYPTCRWTHAPVEGVVRLRAEYGFGPADVERVEVASFAETSTLMTFPPADSDGAQYCLPWAVAAVLVDGELGLDQVLPGRLGDPAIVALGRRVVFRQADDLQARFPTECLARVRVVLKDGRTLEGPTLGARGDYTDPASGRGSAVAARSRRCRVIPHPRVLLEQLDPAQVEAVYRAALRILDETGLAVALPDAAPVHAARPQPGPVGRGGRRLAARVAGLRQSVRGGHRRAAA